MPTFYRNFNHYWREQNEQTQQKVWRVKIFQVLGWRHIAHVIVNVELHLMDFNFL